MSFSAFNIKDGLLSPTQTSNLTPSPTSTPSSIFYLSPTQQSTTNLSHTDISDSNYLNTNNNSNTNKNRCNSFNNLLDVDQNNHNNSLNKSLYSIESGTGPATSPTSSSNKHTLNEHSNNHHSGFSTIKKTFKKIFNNPAYCKSNKNKDLPSNIQLNKFTHNFENTISNTNMGGSNGKKLPVNNNNHNGGESASRSDSIESGNGTACGSGSLGSASGSKFLNNINNNNNNDPPLYNQSKSLQEKKKNTISNTTPLQSPTSNISLRSDFSNSSNNIDKINSASHSNISVIQVNHQPSPIYYPDKEVHKAFYKKLDLITPEGRWLIFFLN